MNHNQKKGIGYFNLAKGIGMVLIILGHSITPVLSPVSNTSLFSGAGSVLGGGIMMAFFMISGYGFFKRSFKKCFSIQAKLLLRPYCIVAIAVLVTKVLLAIMKRRSFWNHGGELVLTYLLGLNAEGGGELWGIPIESNSIFWFVLALFGSWIIYNGIMHVKSRNLQIFLIVGTVVVGYIMTMISSVWPFSIHLACIAVGAVALGDNMRKNQWLERKISIKVYGCILVFSGISMAYGEVNMVVGVWKLGLLDVIGAGCVGFLLLRFYTVFMDKNCHGKMIVLLEAIGFYSIWIICLHAYEKVIIPWHHVYAMFSDYSYIAVVLCFGGRCVIMYVLYKIVNYMNVRWKKRERKKQWKYKGKCNE